MDRKVSSYGSPLAVAIHGGAGTLKLERARRKLPDIKRAIDAAWAVLESGEPGLVAVGAALRVLEDSEHFNAGYGGYPNSQGIVLLDVGIMSGDLRFVSILNARRVKYPSAIAVDMLKHHETLMTLWTHERMTALDSAPEELKLRYGWVPTHEDLVAPSVKELLKEPGIAEVTAGHGTVGCVVRDSRGDLYAGTSTGGTYLKQNGRIGDTPFIGSGVFADNEVCALSATGHGETLMRGLLSGFIIAELRRVMCEAPETFLADPGKLAEILHGEFERLRRRVPARGGGLIVIPRLGNPCFACNSEMISVGMKYYRGEAPHDGPVEEVLLQTQDQKFYS